ncbi:MAG: serine/threonine-protein kinase [Kofleriaceae bacterium]
MPELPTTFGKYYLTEKLATGGMAEIYLAKLIGPGGFEKLVVIKQILPKLSGQRHFVNLFVAEAKTLVTLAHGNIVPVYELGVVEDTYFIAMDYIDGPTLYRLTERMSRREEKMEPAVAAWIAARILEGLDYAHRKGDGVIHRDLSPRNVMLSRDGEVKLVDFGIAVTLGDEGETESHQSAPTGSFPYMSPEQVRKESLTPQTDLFTTGVLAWEMLTGERLFARNDADATLAAVQRGTIAKPSARRPGIPAKLDDIVMRALERDQALRWPTAGEMLAALNKYLYSLDETPGPREVAALVAQFCPPETRRLPTHVEAELGAEVPSGPARIAGPSTAVIPRAAAAAGRPKRHQTFATHVELRGLLGDDPADGAPQRPSGPIGHVITDERYDPTPLPRPRPAPITQRPRRPNTDRPELDDSVPIERPIQPPLEIERLARAPSGAILILIGLGGIGMAIAVVYMFFDGRDHVLRMGDAGVHRTVVVDAGLDAASPADAEEPDAAVAPDAAAPPDAAVTRPPRDAGTVLAVVRDARPNADVALVRPDAEVATGTATLQLGADPWAKVYIDGKLQKAHAPGTYQVATGHHDVKLVYDVESPAREKAYSIDIKLGETQSYQADFTH